MALNKKEFNFAVIKWMLTGSLALLPVLFHCSKDYVLEGKFNFYDACASGEFFLVAIVLVAEPLWELFRIPNKTLSTMVILVIVLLLILLSSHFYSVIDTGRKSITTEGKTASELYIEIQHENEQIKNKKIRLQNLSLLIFACATAVGLLSLYHSNQHRLENYKEE